MIPPLKVTPSSAELFHVAPLLTVTSPVNVFVPAVPVILSLPLIPPPTVVAPFTVKSKPAALKVVPLSIFKFPLIVVPTTVVVDAVPLNVRSPSIVVVPVFNVLTPLPDRVRL